VLRTALKPRWLALLAVVLVVAAGMARLGQWQWDRAHDNAAKNVEKRVTADPVNLDQVLRPRTTFTGAAADRPVVVMGRYDVAGQRLVPQRRLDGRTGFWVLTPLVTLDGNAIGVVRGWVATADDPAAQPDAVPAGLLALDGVLRPAEPPAERAPGQGSGLPPGQLDRIDMTQLITAWTWPLYTGYLVLTGYSNSNSSAGTQVTLVPPATPSLELVPPAVTGGGGLDLRNLSYAVQWFVFAGFGIFMWWRLVRDDHLGVLRGPDPDPDPDPRPTPHEGATL
jgi:cytochrome oxidase assembly protein ShyY1